MFELDIAKRHITSDPRMVLFTVLAVALSIAVIVVMMGINEGYRNDLIESLVENNPHLVVGPKEDEDYITLHRSLQSILEGYPQVVAASPRLLLKAGAKHRDLVRPVNIIGADPQYEEPLQRVQEDMLSGRYYDLIFKKRGAIIGSGLAEELGLSPGEKFTLIRKNESMKLEVSGIIRTGSGADESLVYLPLESAQELIGGGDVVSEVSARLSDIDAAPMIAEDLNSRLSYRTESWQEKNRDVLQVFDTQKVVLSIFYTLIFIIALFGVANTMIMAVTRRTKEIGILMAIGASRGSIIRIFMLESLMLGPPAAILGIALAFGTASLIEAYPISLPSSIYMVSNLTVLLSRDSLTLASGYAIAVNFFAGLYPAYRASRLDPVVAIGD